MGRLYSLDEQAATFAESFPDADRDGVREWYLEQLKRDRERGFWKRLEAGATVFVLVGVLPSLALWAYFTLS
ncbi:MAG TPA: hypothetical protein VLL76_00610 [Candidatus Omnitrophota bacterium]|nr:hypothetical protein [Candidatus Omnitrophota bacterium]